MVNIGTALSGLSLAISLGNRSREDEKAEERAKEKNADPGKTVDEQLQQETADRLDQLVQFEERNRPGPHDKDAFASSVIELDPGEVATVTVEPQSGYNLRVKEVYFDRRVDHEYTINVGGDVNSVSHKAVYRAPKKVSQSDRVVAEVTNNSSSTTVIDFELEAWAERSDK